jgi:O-antigen/teichoic acid export membrane protein
MPNGNSTFVYPMMSLNRTFSLPTQLLDYLDAFRAHLRAPLYSNAYMLILNQFAAAALGIVYWMLAARLYGAQIVGHNVALFSSVMLLTAVAELGLRAGVTRYVPRAGARTPRLILSTYGIIALTSALAASVFFGGGRFLFPDASWASLAPIQVIGLTAATIVWSIFDLSDNVLTGMRETRWLVLKNTAFNTTKMLLLIVGVQLFHDYGIIGSWFIAAALILVPLNVWMFRRLVPRHIAATAAHARPLMLRQMLPSVAGDYVGTMLSEISIRALPLVVLAQLGSSASAYFYQAWIFSTLLQLIVAGMTNSFTVEASAQLEQIARYSRRTLLHTARLIVPAVMISVIFAPWVLGLFGEAYAREGTTLFRWLALATLPFVLTTWYLSYARVLGEVRMIIVIQGFLLVSTLGLTLVWLPLFGLAGVGLAWCISQTLAAGLVAWKTAPLWLARRASFERMDANE